jgi:hypothetical protein
MDSAMTERLTRLRTERVAGLRRLEELAAEYDRTRETLLRICGAIQVLEELTAATPAEPVAVTA